MIDFNSIHTFVKSISTVKHPKSENLLDIKVHSPQQVVKNTSDLVKLGYLTSISFAHARNLQVVFRLKPNKKMRCCKVSLVEKRYVQGLTIASELENFVSGRIAQDDIMSKPKDFLLEWKEDLLHFADLFGGSQSIHNIYEQIDLIQSVPTSLRSGKVWEVSAPENALCQILSVAWTTRGQKLNAWVNEATNKYKDMNIYWRLYLTSNIYQKTNVDVTQALNYLILNDYVFDPLYISFANRPSFGIWNSDPLVTGIRWFLKNGKDSNILSISPKLWSATKQYAESPETYNGRLHLEFAYEIANSDPLLAFTQTANAAAFYNRATKRSPVDAIKFGYELAKNNNWNDIAEILDWGLQE